MRGSEHLQQGALPPSGASAVRFAAHHAALHDEARYIAGWLLRAVESLERSKHLPPSEKARLAAAVTMLEEILRPQRSERCRKHRPLAPIAEPPSVDPMTGYGHPAHRPDPNATYRFEPGPRRTLPVDPRRRWRLPG
jgi:hypothetical protein